MLRIGQGVDVHAFCAGDHIMLGGVRIPHHHGFAAHSDGDVLLHALTDALLGALGWGDIGEWFPPSEARWKDADSRTLLTTVWHKALAQGWRLQNADLTVVAEAPRLGPWKGAIRTSVAKLLQVQEETVSIKATTTEKLGFCGREEGVAALAVVLLQHG